MLNINAITPNSQIFQSKTTSLKLAEQKVEKLAQDKDIPKVIQDALQNNGEKFAFVTKDLSFMVKPTSKVNDEIGAYVARQAAKEYESTSAKLAEQKGKKLFQEV